MDQAVKEFLQGKRLAVVGASRSGKKFGNTIAAELDARGYEVLLVHPEAPEIGGMRCYPNLAALRGMADGVVICVTPRQAGQAVREAAAAGITKIWLQQGADSPEVQAAAAEAGVNPVRGKCILMYASPSGKVPGMHGLHGAIWKLIGQY